MKFSPPSHPAYQLIDQRYLPIWNSPAYVYQHRSGARVLSICSDDDNKTFGIVFPTLPTDDSGLPHILEHCVLCGSERFPVKEPFKEMLKTSLQTFLNAFTYPDRTCYPVASQNLQDFYHLTDVYLDAVFFPRITPAVLGQEGWRLEWNANNQLEFQGVVFNEMKGSYASAESRMDEVVRQALFPDTTHRFDYGGDPDHIPDLSFEQFIAFHRAHYHPANAFIGFYGDDDPQARLERLDEVLSRVPRLDPPPPGALQSPWTAPKTIEDAYPCVEGGDEGVFCQLNWLLPGDITDPMNAQMVSLAASLLLNSPASPLRLALLDSGLGDDLIGGPILYLQQPAFGVGLRGVQPGSEQEVFDCIRNSLESIVRDNFRPDLMQGVLNMTEFQIREMNTSNKGLSAILSGIQPWMYGGNPLDALDPEPRLAAIAGDLKDNPRLFAEWIQVNLLENRSRVDVILRPDDHLTETERNREKTRLQELQELFAAEPERLQTAKDLAGAVRDFQQIPDSPAALATLPRLGLGDISPLPAPLPFDLAEESGVEISTTGVHSNQIVYIQLAFDFHHLTLDELALLPLYSRCLTELGTHTLDHLQFNEQVACHTGGISAQFETSDTYYSDDPLAVMILKSKCLESNLVNTVNLLTDMLTRPLLGPADRIHQLLLEERSNEEADIVQSGNQVVRLRLKATFSAMERASEEMDGVRYLMRLRDYETLSPKTLLKRVQALHRRLITRHNLRLHIGGDPSGIEQAREQLGHLLSTLPPGTNDPTAQWPLLDLAGPEGLVTSSPVQFVGLATQLPLSGAATHFSHFVAQRLINNDYLWERVRMRGGAYGSACAFSHLDGQLTFTSYRDPHIQQTLDIYRGAGQWLQDLDLSAGDLEQAVIGTLGKLSPPERPSSQVSKNFFRHLLGLTFAQRQRFWQDIRDTTPDHLRAFGAQLTQAMETESGICVLGGEKAFTRSGLPLNLTHLQV
ncbi:MAG: insulinase family protein [Kiritimatiellia bacterium]